MIAGIKRDHLRFKQIVKGKIKQNLKKFISQGEMIGRQGKDYVSIPIPQIDLPHFRFGKKQAGGVGQGDGAPGTPLGPGQDESAQPQAGNADGQHVLEVDISLQELAEMLGQELELPRIQPKGSGTMHAHKYKYSGIHTVGPDSLRHVKRTYKQALKRQIIMGNYDPNNPVIVPIKKDYRYRMWKSVTKPENNAVIVYMMDVSGSMGDEQKEIVRTESFWIDTWLRSQYNDIDIRYIIHDASAREVDQDTFYHTRESGGTLISSAYKLCNDILDKEYPASDWNIYALHFSDGDNWSGEDTRLCIDMLNNQLLPKCNLFCYGQVESRYGSGQFIKDLMENFKTEERLVTSKIESKEAIYRSLKEFLGKGK
jgi:sporulation protein YhbH